jgi:hypothetical protein
MVGLADDVRSWDQSGPPGYAARGWGVVKSLGDLSSGPVGLVHTRKAGIKYKKPTSPNSWYPRDIGLAISAHSAPSV